MAPYNTALYEKLRGSVENACKDSLSWRPHTEKYHNLIETILSEDIVARNVKWWNRDKLAADEAASWLGHFFEGYQEETNNGLIWNAHAFDVVYSKLEEFLYNDSYVSHFVSLLAPFSCDSLAPVELWPGVFIRKPDALLSAILRNQPPRAEYPLGIGDWVVDITLEQPKSVERDAEDGYSSKAMSQLRLVLQSLRLLHSGKTFVGPLCYLTFPEFGGFERNVAALFQTDLTTLSPNSLRFTVLGGYELKEGEVSGLRTVYGFLEKKTGHYPDSFMLGLSRFNDYFGRANQLDGLLDLVIALEALFAGGSQEIRYGLAVRCSCFLESDITQREAVFGRLKDIYDIRSSVVHGQPSLPRKWRKLRGDDFDAAIASIVDDAEEYVRRSIGKVVEEGHLSKFQSSEQWRKFLDKLVLSGHSQE